MKKIRHIISQRLFAPKKCCDGQNERAIAFKRATFISAKTERLNPDIAVKSVMPIGESIGGGAKKQTYQDTDNKKRDFGGELPPGLEKDGMGNIWDKNKTYEPGDRLVLFPNRLKRENIKQSPNFGWISPAAEGDEQEEKEKPTVILKKYKVNPKTDDIIPSSEQILNPLNHMSGDTVDDFVNGITSKNEIKTKILPGRPLKDRIPGGRLIARAAAMVGVITDANNKFRCPPGTPAANQFTDMRGTTCFGFSTSRFARFAYEKAAELTDAGELQGFKRFVGRASRWFQTGSWDDNQGINNLPVNRPVEYFFGRTPGFDPVTGRPISPDWPSTDVPDSAGGRTFKNTMIRAQERLKEAKKTVDDLMTNLGVDTSEAAKEKNDDVYETFDRLKETGQWDVKIEKLTDPQVRALVIKELKNRLARTPGAPKLNELPDEIQERLIQSEMKRFRVTERALATTVLEQFALMPEHMKKIKVIKFTKNAAGEEEPDEGSFGFAMDAGKPVSTIYFNLDKILENQVIGIPALRSDERLLITAEGGSSDAERAEAVADFITSANDFAKNRAALVSGVESFSRFIALHEIGHSIQGEALLDSITRQIEETGEVVLPDGRKLKVSSITEITGVNWNLLLTDYAEKVLLENPETARNLSNLANVYGKYPRQYHDDLGRFFIEAQTEMWALREMGLINGDDVDAALSSMDMYQNAKLREERLKRASSVLDESKEIAPKPKSMREIGEKTDEEISDDIKTLRKRLKDPEISDDSTLIRVAAEADMKLEKAKSEFESLTKQIKEKEAEISKDLDFDIAKDIDELKEARSKIKKEINFYEKSRQIAKDEWKERNTLGGKEGSKEFEDSVYAFRDSIGAYTSEEEAEFLEKAKTNYFKELVTSLDDKTLAEEFSSIVARIEKNEYSSPEEYEELIKVSEMMFEEHLSRARAKGDTRTKNAIRKSLLEKVDEKLSVKPKKTKKFKSSADAKKHALSERKKLRRKISKEQAEAVREMKDFDSNLISKILHPETNAQAGRAMNRANARLRRLGLDVNDKSSSDGSMEDQVKNILVPTLEAIDASSVSEPFEMEAIIELPPGELTGKAVGKEFDSKGFVRGRVIGKGHKKGDVSKKANPENGKKQKRIIVTVKEGDRGIFPTATGDEKQMFVIPPGTMKVVGRDPDGTVRVEISRQKGTTEVLDDLAKDILEGPGDAIWRKSASAKIQKISDKRVVDVPERLSSGRSPDRKEREIVSREIIKSAKEKGATFGSNSEVDDFFDEIADPESPMFALRGDLQEKRDLIRNSLQRLSSDKDKQRKIEKFENLMDEVEEKYENISSIFGETVSWPDGKTPFERRKTKDGEVYEWVPPKTTSQSGYWKKVSKDMLDFQSSLDAERSDRNSTFGSPKGAPSNPSRNDIFTNRAGRSYKWDGARWERIEDNTPEQRAANKLQEVKKILEKINERDYLIRQPSKKQKYVDGDGVEHEWVQTSRGGSQGRWMPTGKTGLKPTPFTPFDKLEKDELDPKIERLLSTSSSNEIDKKIEQAVIKFHQGLDSRPRVRMRESELDDFAETGQIRATKRTGASTIPGVSRRTERLSSGAERTFRPGNKQDEADFAARAKAKIIELYEKIEAPYIPPGTEDADAAKIKRDHLNKFFNTLSDAELSTFGLERLYDSDGKPKISVTTKQVIYAVKNAELAVAMLAMGQTVRVDDGLAKNEPRMVENAANQLNKLLKEVKDSKGLLNAIDLCKVYAEGVNVFCSENLGIDRREMPQVGGRARNHESVAMKMWKSQLATAEVLNAHFVTSDGKKLKKELGIDKQIDKFRADGNEDAANELERAWSMLEGLCHFNDGINSGQLNGKEKITVEIKLQGKKSVVEISPEEAKAILERFGVRATGKDLKVLGEKWNKGAELKRIERMPDGEDKQKALAKLGKVEKLTPEEQEIFFSHLDYPYVEADGLDNFIDFLELTKVSVGEEEITPANTLKASQREVQADKVDNLGKIMKGELRKVKAGYDKILSESGKDAAEKWRNQELERLRREHGLFKKIIVSNDGYIVDGHHRVIGRVVSDAYEDDVLLQLGMTVRRVDMPIIELLTISRIYQDALGIKPASLNDKDPETYLEQGIEAIGEITQEEIDVMHGNLYGNLEKLQDQIYEAGTFIEVESVGLRNNTEYLDKLLEQQKASVQRNRQRAEVAKAKGISTTTEPQTITQPDDESDRLSSGRRAVQEQINETRKQLKKLNTPQDNETEFMKEKRLEQVNRLKRKLNNLIEIKQRSRKPVRQLFGVGTDDESDRLSSGRRAVQEQINETRKQLKKLNTPQSGETEFLKEKRQEEVQRLKRKLNNLIEIKQRSRKSVRQLFGVGTGDRQRTGAELASTFSSIDDLLQKGKVDAILNNYDIDFDNIKISEEFKSTVDSVANEISGLKPEQIYGAINEYKGNEEFNKFIDGFIDSAKGQISDEESENLRKLGKVVGELVDKYAEDKTVRTATKSAARMAITALRMLIDSKYFNNSTQALFPSGAGGTSSLSLLDAWIDSGARAISKTEGASAALDMLVVGAILGISRGERAQNILRRFTNRRRPKTRELAETSGRLSSGASERLSSGLAPFEKKNMLMSARKIIKKSNIDAESEEKILFAYRGIIDHDRYGTNRDLETITARVRRNSGETLAKLMLQKLVDADKITEEQQSRMISRLNLNVNDFDGMEQKSKSIKNAFNDGLEALDSYIKRQSERRYRGSSSLAGERLSSGSGRTTGDNFAKRKFGPDEFDVDENSQANASISALRREYWNNNGLNDSINDEEFPVTGYLVHNSQIDAKKKMIKQNGSGNVGDDAIFELQDSDIFGDGLTAQGEIEIVLSPEVANRTAYGRGSAIKNGNKPVSMRSASKRDIAQALIGTDESTDTEAAINMLTASIDNDFSSITSRKQMGSKYRQVGESVPKDFEYEQIQAHILGGFDKDEVESINYPFSKIQQIAKNEELKDIEDEKSIAAMLRKAGFTEAEINYFYSMSDGKPFNTQSMQALRAYRAAQKVRQKYQRHGFNKVNFAHPEGINIDNPSTYSINARIGQSVEEVLKKNIAKEIAQEAKTVLREMRSNTIPKLISSGGRRQ